MTNSVSSYISSHLGWHSTTGTGFWEASQVQKIRQYPNCVQNSWEKILCICSCGKVGAAYILYIHIPSDRAETWNVPWLLCQYSSLDSMSKEEFVICISYLILQNLQTSHNQYTRNFVLLLGIISTFTLIIGDWFIFVRYPYIAVHSSSYCIYLFWHISGNHKLIFINILSVSDYVKSRSWCHRRRAHSWNGEPLGREMGIGKEGGGGKG